MVFFMGIYLLVAEFLSFDQSKGEVLVFRRGHLKTAFERACDEESQSPGPNSQVLTSGNPVNDTDSNPPVRLQPQASIFHWTDVCYDISVKGKNRKILDHVDGWVKPGTLTALMVRNENSS
jgi:ATP-binding cassette subfamily G (WHITE) protein 2 (PDR)